MDDARRRGFSGHLLYIGLEDVQIAIDRIAVRVAQGGHGIPAADVRRRFARSLGHLRAAIARADRTMLIDNTTEQGPHEVLVIEGGRTTWRATDLPRWLDVALGAVRDTDDVVEPGGD